MTEPITGPGARPTGPTADIRKTTGSAPLAPQPGARPDAARSAAFEALLESLEAKARALEDQSRGVERPAELAEAVETAHDSLEAVLSLGDRLLEAYRETLQRGETRASGPSADDASAGPVDTRRDARP